MAKMTGPQLPQPRSRWEGPEYALDETGAGLLRAYVARHASPWEPDMTAGLALADLLEEQGHPFREEVREVVGTEIVHGRREGRDGARVRKMLLAVGRRWWVTCVTSDEDYYATGYVNADSLSVYDDAAHRTDDGRLPRSVAVIGGPQPTRVEYLFRVGTGSGWEDDLDPGMVLTLTLAARLAGCLTVLALLVQQDVDFLAAMAGPIESVQLSGRGPLVWAPWPPARTWEETP